MPETPSPLLSLRGLHKAYAAPVLIDISFDLLAGEVHGLIGANGAGKSTLSRIVCGLTPPDAGSMRLDGRPYAPVNKLEAERAGVQMVMQELNLVPTLSVAENLFLNRLPRRMGLIDYRRLGRAAEEALERVGLTTLDPSIPVGRLGIGEQQLVEIASVLARECRVLILDEPTAALTDPEIDLLFERIGWLRAQGVGVIYVSHRMEEIRRITDRVTVLRDGRVADTRPTEETSTERIIQLMVGEQVLAYREHTRRPAGAVALRVEHLSRGERVRDVSFEVRRGEIFGLAGLVGSGRTEALRAIFGADTPESGRILLGEAGTAVSIRQPRDAVRAGIGMIPEDRKDQGLLLTQPIRTNLTLAHLATVVRRGGWIDSDREVETANRLRDALRVQSHSVEQPAVELSGGNQQKVVIARWLLRETQVLLFDEPTRGIDVSARETVYELLDRLADAGKALVVVSSELRELMLLCDRIGVMSAGRLVATFTRGDWDQDRIMAAAISGYLNPNSSIHAA